jgi:hypothetical protein
MTETEEQMVRIFQALIKQFSTQFFQAFLNLLVGKISNTVLQIVQDVGAKTDWSNEEKRKEAIGKIKTIAYASGMDLKESTISLAVEIAVKIWKGWTI